MQFVILMLSKKNRVHFNFFREGGGGVSRILKVKKKIKNILILFYFCVVLSVQYKFSFENCVIQKRGNTVETTIYFYFLNDSQY